MSPSAFVLGGTGLIGRALVPRLLEEGYSVTVGSRTGAEIAEDVRHVLVDRSNDDDLDAAVGGDIDLFIDVVAYDEKHAQQLTNLEGRVGFLVVISSAAVYADVNGRTLLGSPDGSDAPIRESDPVVAPVPDGSDYAGGKVTVENTVLDTNMNVAVLRPGAIFGPGDRASREWHFAKRAIDGRTPVVLAYDGASRFHHVSSTTVATMIIGAHKKRFTGALNCGDADPRNVTEICAAVGRVMDHDFEIVPISGPPRGVVGDHPWAVPHPFVMDLSLAVKVQGAAAPYERALSETCEWLRSATDARPWRDALPAAARHYGDYFDYEAEDAFLAQHDRQ